MRRSFRWALPGLAVPCILAAAVLAAGCFKLDGSEAPTPPLSEIRATRTVTSFEAFHEIYSDLHLPGMPAPAAPQTQETHTLYRDGAWRDEISKGTNAEAVNIREGDHATNWVTGQSWATRVTFRGGSVSASLKLPPYAAGSLEDVVRLVTAVRADAKLTGEATIAGRRAYVVEVTVPPCTGLPADLTGPQTLWFDRETLMVLKQEQRSADDGRVTLRSETTSVTYDVSLTDDLFAPPAGMPIREVTVPALGQGVTTSSIPEIRMPTGSATPHSWVSSSYIVVTSSVDVGSGGMYGAGLSGGCATPTPTP